MSSEGIPSQRSRWIKMSTQPKVFSVAQRYGQGYMMKESNSSYLSTIFSLSLYLRLKLTNDAQGL